jgi:O-antigen/teichoic acid export membrane protein
MLGKNVVAGFGSSVWAAALGFAVIPSYLKYLGVEAYGLIGFFVTAQAMFQLLDMGLAPTINREVARHAAAGNLPAVAPLLHTLARVYWLIALVIGVVVLALSPLIADHWLHAQHLSNETLRRAVILLGLVIACRWPVGLYQGVLMGAQRIPTSSAIIVVMSTLSGLGAVTILANVSPTIEAFFVWQAIVGLAQALLMRRAAWRTIAPTDRPAFSVEQLKRVWRFSAGMGGIALLGLVFMQLDKVILSRLLELKDFGSYVLASTVVSALYILVSPLFNALYPRFTGLVAAGDTQGVAALYRLATRGLGCLLFPLAMALVISGHALIALWTGNPAIADTAAPLVALLAVGSALHGIMHIPHALQLGFAAIRLPLIINATLAVLLVPLIVGLSLTYGALGGAMAWLMLHILYVALGSWLTHRTLLPGLRAAWLLQDVGIPLVTTVVVGGIARTFLDAMPLGDVARLALTAVTVVLAALAAVAVSPRLRRALLDRLPKRTSPLAPGEHVTAPGSASK